MLKKAQKKKAFNKIIPILVVGLFILSSKGIQVVSAQTALEPDTIEIYGEIADNYVSVTYELHFDNTGSVDDREIDWSFGIQNDILLSNLSIILGSMTYWGVVKPELVAEQEYNESVERNETAVLMKQIDSGYSLLCNLEAGLEAQVFITLEGFLTRKLGGYSLALPLSLSQEISSTLTVDLTVRSNFNPVVSYGIRGLSGLGYDILSGGIHITYDSGSVILIPSNLEVQYRLGAQTGGSQLITYSNSTDNFFAYMLAPVLSESAETERQVVFVIDTSGSMGGTPLAQAKSAFGDMILNLNPGDCFNVVAFGSDPYQLWAESMPATATNINIGRNWVVNLETTGVTNFYGGAQMGLDSFVDNGQPKIMLLLSDGLPNAGTYTTPETIGPAILEANTLAVSISTIAFTNSVDLDFMGGIASDNNGFFTYITPDANSAAEILDFYATLSVQDLQEYSISISGANDFAHFRPIPEGFLANGSENLMTGRYSSQIVFVTTLQYEEITEIYYNNETTPGTEYEHVEKLWAQQRISYLLHRIGLGESSFEDEVIQLGMYYGLVIKGYTALIITTDDEETPMKDDYNPDGAPPLNSPSDEAFVGVPGYPLPVIIAAIGFSLVFILKKTNTVEMAESP